MPIMKLIRFIVSLLVFVSLPLHAEDEVLKVAVNGFSPPFVMQSANKQLYGFDINLMERMCKLLKRTCQFEMMRFQDLLSAVQTRRADVALSSITITPERAELVNFSMPYLLSNVMILGNKGKVKGTFSTDMLDNSTIGFEKGTALDSLVATLNIQNPKIIRFDKLTDEIEALNNKKIDFALMDEPAARYWQIQSSGSLIALGKPILFGYGIAIAVNKDQIDLLEQLNDALKEYENSNEYKEIYNRYIAYF